MNAIVTQLALASAGLALAALASGAALRAWRRRPIEAYRLLVLVLFASLALPALQLAGASLELPALARLGAAGRALRAALSPAPVPEPELTPVPASGVTAPLPPDAAGDPSRALLAALLASEELDAPFAGAPDRRAPGAPAQPAPSAAATALRPDASERAPDAGRVRLIPALVTLYLAGLALRATRTIRRLRRTAALLRAARPARDGRALAIWRELCERSRVARRTRLFESAAVCLPACFGLRRPVVLLPAEPRPRAEDPLRCVLLHELVHLERRDTWSLLAQELFACLFWFHPAAWWLARRLDALRELSCDLLVVRRTGRRKRYASALVEYASAVQSGDAATAALVPWTDSDSQLRRRIEMLVEASPHTSRRSRGLVLTAVASAFASLWLAQLTVAAAAFSQPVQEPVEETAPEPEDELAAAIAAARRVTALEPELEPEGEPAAPYAQEPAPALQAEPPRIGIHVGTVDPALAAHLGAARETLILVHEVQAGSLAARAGLQRYDVIAEIDGQPALHAQLDAARARLAGGHGVTLRVFRRGQPQRVVLGTGSAEHDAALEAYDRVLGAHDQGRHQEAAEAYRRALEYLQRVRPDEASEAHRRLIEALTRARTDESGRFEIDRLRVPAQTDEVRARVLEEHRKQAERLRADPLLLPRPSGDWAELVKRYYDSVDTERFRADLHKGMAEARKLSEAGHLGPAEERYWKSVQQILESDVEHYLDWARNHMQSADPDELRAQVDKQMADLEGWTQGELVRRWRRGADAGAADPNASNRSRYTKLHPLYQKQLEADRADELRTLIQTLEAELARNRQELEDMRAQIRALKHQER